MRVRLFQCRISTSASGPATPHNIENYSNELLYMLSGYFKTSVLDFVQQLIKTCAYINIYKASDIQTILAKNRGTISDFLCDISRLPPSPPFNVDVAL